MPKKGCRLCRNARILLLSVLLGGVCGFSVIALDGSTNMSMTATFFGAITPLLWKARKNRIDRSPNE